ncbi:EF-hand [Trichoderma chlorosporum]
MPPLATISLHRHIAPLFLLIQFNPRQSISNPPALQETDNKDNKEVSQRTLDAIDEVFDLFNEKEPWLISHGFKHALTALGINLSKPESCEELDNYGKAPPDWPSSHCPVNWLLIYRDKFRECAIKHISKRTIREEAINVFEVFDRDEDGIISFEDMMNLSEDIKTEYSLSEDWIRGMIDYADHDGKGGVNLEEFVQMMEISYGK